MLDNNKLMLIFGFSEDEKKKLSDIIGRESLPNYKVIANEMASMTIKDILEGKKFEVVSENLPEEKAIVFNNLDDKELDKAIRAVRGEITSSAILAVVTPTSIEWSFKYLLEHLIEEREWHRAQKRGE